MKGRWNTYECNSATFRAQLISRPEARIGGFEPRGWGGYRLDRWRSEKGGDAEGYEWRDMAGRGVEGVDAVLACRYPWKFNHAASL